MASRVERHLCVILAADVAGYSRLMRNDEEGTLAQLVMARKTMDARVAAHEGRVVNSVGDSVLAEFSSVVGAIQASIEIQREIDAASSGIDAEKRVLFRIGLQLGEVMVRSTDIYGDGVNVAARLQTLADPGGIVVSGTVYDQLRDRVPAPFVDLGQQSVKNIERPVPAYGLSRDAIAAMPMADEIVSPSDNSDAALAVVDRHRRRRIVAGIVLIAIVICGTGAWQFYRVSVQGAKEAQPEVKPIAMSLAIGNFTAPAEDAAAARFARTLGRDLATTLGAVEHSVQVISTASSAEVQSTTDEREAARRAGARYVVDGDVRSGADHASINLRLVDTEHWTQVWSGRFDLGYAESSLATTVAGRKVVGELAGAVRTVESNRVLRKPVNQLDAMELVLRGYAAWGPANSLANAREVRKLADAAVHLDPNLAAAMELEVSAADYLNDMDPQPDHDRYVRETDEFSSRAVALDPSNSRYWISRAVALMLLGNWNASLEASERAIKLDPYSAVRYSQRAWLMTMMARPADAVALTDQALTLYEPNPGWTLRCACEAHLLLGEPEKAIEKCERASGFMAPDWGPYFFLPAAYANAGDMDHAAASLKTMLQAVPGYTIAQLRAKRYSDHPEYQKLAEKYWYAGLRKAGLPEK